MSLQLPFVIFWLVVPSVIEALLLRAAVASVNRLLKPQPSLIEPSFGLGLATLLIGNIGAAILCYCLPSTIPFPAQIAIGVVAQWIYVCLVLKDHLRNSIALAVSVVILQFIYMFGISLIFAIPYALLN